MRTRSSDNWLRKPGGFDPLRCDRLFESSSSFGIPDLLPQTFAIPEDCRLMPYRSRLDRLDQDRDICHFYLDDYRFEPTWNRIEPSWRHVSGYFATMTPVFSLYASWPTALQIWNTYRSRWLGRYWQERGCNVIPTMNWSDEASFDFCFDGVPQGQVLSISVADLRRPHVEKRFRDGLDAMLERLSPRLLLVYGQLPFALDCPVLEFAPAWCELRKLG